MKKKKEEIKSRRDERKVEEKKPKKEFKIEIEKVGKLEENTSGAQCNYDCNASA